MTHDRSTDERRSGGPSNDAAATPRGDHTLRGRGWVFGATSATGWARGLNQPA